MSAVLNMAWQALSFFPAVASLFLLPLFAAWVFAMAFTIIKSICGGIR